MKLLLPLECSKSQQFVRLRDPGHFLPLFVMISTPLVSLHALGLIAMVSALRHYEDDMAHENLVRVVKRCRACQDYDLS